VRWGAAVSEFFLVGNGVRQGGILSPYLFNVYLDDLCVRLNNAATGCNFNDLFYNNFAYADDLALAAPSPSSLQKLVNICETYGLEFDIIFNPLKSWCMCIKGKKIKINSIPSINLNGNVLEFVDKIKYLGVFISSDFCDDKDMQRQLSMMYVHSNSLIRQFNLCTFEVKKVLFKSYCCNYYCSQLWWCYSQNTENKLRTAFNKGLRKLLNYERMYSAKSMFCENDIDNYDVLCRKYMYKFYMRLSKSENMLVKNLVTSVHFLASKFMNKFFKTCT